MQSDATSPAPSPGAAADGQVPGMDRFGNRIDPSVGYARGSILSDAMAEVRRQGQAHALMRDRYRRFGEGGVFNLTGLIRGYPYAEGDEAALKSYVHFEARGSGGLERLALERMGGARPDHDGFLANRVSAGILAIMITLLTRGDQVMSLVPADRSHPSIKQAVDVAGGEMVEFLDIAAFEEAVRARPPKMVVITAISPSKVHLPQEQIRRAIAAARAAGSLVFLDDAHMAARVLLYAEPPALAFAPDIAVWSLDKHVTGPRSGFVAGRAELITRIRAKALSLGLEAQLGPYLAGLRAIEAFDPEPVLKAKATAERVLEAIQADMEGRAYLAGAGIAVSGEDFLEIATRRANGDQPAIVPIEAMAFTAMELLATHGAATIPATGMPGAACTFRLMMYPDGERMGEGRIIEGARLALSSLTSAVSDPGRVRQVIFGSG